MVDIPILLLAAGSSRRMGQPKQLLPWGEKTLIEHQIQNLLKTGNPVNVILGSNSDLIIPVIEKLDINIIINNDWENGMGSSIAKGVNYLAGYFIKADGVMITLVDQPMVTNDHIHNMLHQFKPGNRQIFVSKAASGWKGVPALFDNFYFEDLKKLKGEEGAKKIIHKYPKAVISIDCGNQLEDIDTQENYRKFLNSI